MSTSNKSSTNDKKKYYKKVVTFSVILSTKDTDVLKNDELLKQLAYLNNYGHIDRILLDIGAQDSSENVLPDDTLSNNKNIKEEFASNIKFNLNNIPVGNKYVFLTDDIKRLDNNKFDSIRDKNIVPIVCKNTKIYEMVKFLQRLRFENVILENKSRERNVYLHVNMDKPEGKKFNNLHKFQKSSKVLGRIKRYMETKLGELSTYKGYYGLLKNNSHDHKVVNNSRNQLPPEIPGQNLESYNKSKLTINIGLEHNDKFDVNIHINNDNCKFVEHLILGEREDRLPNRVVNYLEGRRESKPTRKHTAKVKRKDRSEQSTRRRRTIKKKDITKVELKMNTAATNNFKDYAKTLEQVDGDGRLKEYSKLKQKLSYLNMKKGELEQDIKNVKDNITVLEEKMPKQQVGELQNFIKNEKLPENARNILDSPNKENKTLLPLTNSGRNNLMKKVRMHEATTEQQDKRQKERKQENLKHKVKKQLSKLGKTKKKGLLAGIARIATRFKRKRTKKQGEK